MNPKLFIASSVEGLAIAEAVKHLLSNDADITIWAEAFFNLSRTPTENFTAALNNFDFGIFIMTPDDSLLRRGRRSLVPRDNLVLEMGMFIERLGKDRTFLILPKETESPSLSPEVIGVSQTTFDPNKSDRNLLASLAPACEQIRKQIRSLGRSSLSTGEIEVRQNIEVLKDGTIIGVQIGDISGELINAGDQKKPATSQRKGVRDRVFVSYSHKDETWLERFQTMLMPLVWNDKISIWDDTKIRPGRKWRDEIKRTLDSTKVALLLVSPYFLASEFIAKHELPPLLEESKNDSVTIIWALLSACFYEKTEIVNYQAAHNISKPLDTLTPGRRSQEVYNICKKIDEALNYKDVL